MIPADILVDYPTMEDEDGTCQKCDHPFGPHVLMATMFSPQHGGVIFCNVVGCLCQSNWSIEGEPMPYIPDDDEIAELRRIAQSDEDAESDWDTNSDIDIWLD